MQYRPDQTLHGAAPIMSSMLFTSAFQIQKRDGLSDMFSMQKVHPILSYFSGDYNPPSRSKPASSSRSAS